MLQRLIHAARLDVRAQVRTWRAGRLDRVSPSLVTASAIVGCGTGMFTVRDWAGNCAIAGPVTGTILGAATGIFLPVLPVVAPFALAVALNKKFVIDRRERHKNLASEVEHLRERHKNLDDDVVHLTRRVDSLSRSVRMPNANESCAHEQLV